MSNVVCDIHIFKCTFIKDVVVFDEKRTFYKRKHLYPKRKKKYLFVWKCKSIIGGENLKACLASLEANTRLRGGEEKFANGETFLAKIRNQSFVNKIKLEILF